MQDLSPWPRRTRKLSGDAGAGHAAARAIPLQRSSRMEIFGAYHGYFMTFIIGLVVGIIAKFLMPGKNPGGFIITALLRILGLSVVTWLGRSLGWYQEGATAGWIASIIGAIILLLIYRVFFKRSATHSEMRRTR